MKVVNLQSWKLDTLVHINLMMMMVVMMKVMASMAVPQPDTTTIGISANALGYVSFLHERWFNDCPWPA